MSMLKKIGSLSLCVIFICAAVYVVLLSMGGSKKLELYFADNEINEQELTEVRKNIDKTKYYYSNLSPSEQNAYEQIYYILKKHESEKEISLESKEELNKVLTCVLNDYPEIFYIDGYSYNLSNKGTLLISPEYTFTQDEIQMKRSLIDNYANTCLDRAPVTDDEYYILKYLYEYIIQHTNYSAISSDNQSICSVMINGVSVCQGYAKTLQYLLSREGIESIFVTGKTNKGINHAWLEVKINGEWYCCDPTWGDTTFNANSIGINSVNYDYLAVSTEEFSKTHLIDNVIDVPMCYEMDENFYKKEGYYLDSYSQDKVIDLYRRALDEGNNNFFFKCENDAVYLEAETDLIGNEVIFDIISESDEITYTNYDDQRTFIFWF